MNRVFENIVGNLIKERDKYKDLKPNRVSTLIKAAHWGGEESIERRRQANSITDEFIKDVFRKYIEGVWFLLTRVGTVPIPTLLAGCRSCSGVDSAFVRAYRVGIIANKDRRPDFTRTLENIAIAIRDLKGHVYKKVKPYVDEIRYNGKDDDHWDTRGGVKNGPLFRKTYSFLSSLLKEEGFSGFEDDLQKAPQVS